MLRLPGLYLPLRSAIVLALLQASKHIAITSHLRTDLRIEPTQDTRFIAGYSKLKLPSNPSSASPLSAYQGTYVGPYYGKLLIDVEGSRLIMRLPPRDAYYELTHLAGDAFTYYFDSENAGVARRGVKFLDGGKQILVENLAIVNDGLFTKVR